MEKVLLPREFVRDPRFRSLSLVNKAALTYVWIDSEPHGLWIVAKDLVEAYLCCGWDPAAALSQLQGIVYPFDDGRRWAIPLWVQVQYRTLKGTSNSIKSVLNAWDSFGILDFLPASLIPKNLRSNTGGVQLNPTENGKENGKGRGRESERGIEHDASQKSVTWSASDLEFFARSRCGTFPTVEKIMGLLAIVPIDLHADLRAVIVKAYQDSGRIFADALDAYEVKLGQTMVPALTVEKMA